jgi:predicted RNA-binding Zn-ribbon protein involved in translation (DUF1610 family)
VPIQVTCQSCRAMFNAPDSGAGKRAKCPKCGAIIQIPVPVPALVDEVVDAEEESQSSFADDEFAVEAPAAIATDGERRPCPKCGEMIQKAAIKCRFCGEIFDPALAAYQQSVRSQRSGGDSSLFLNVSPTRLIVMSLLTSHLYEAYWIYKNWQYLKKRDNLNIWPFWRGIFGVFFCHSLLKRIYEDEDARAVESPAFSATGLATGWVVLVILGNMVSRAPGAVTTIISAVMPSFLCFLPVQQYINSVSKRRGDPYHGWSVGHIVCIVLGLIIWFGVLMELFVLPAEPNGAF